MKNSNNINHLLKHPIDSYSKVASIPWAYSDEKKIRARWIDKTSSYFQFEKLELRYLQNGLNSNQYTGKKKARIQQFVKDKSSHLKSMKKVLSDLVIDSQNPTITDKQNILSYQDLIFRDWVWGKKEIDTYLNYILSHLTGNEKSILVLGAGACGLSYNLAKKTTADIVATDINPYLFANAKQITSNKHIKIMEFVPHPKDIQHVSIKQEIKPQKELPNHHMLFSDFNDMPFTEQSFDLVIACWFYDIIDNELESSIKTSANLLKDDGSLIFIGPSNFHKNKFSEQLTSLEIEEKFSKVFQKYSSEIKEVSYLNNPNSSYKRLEDILFLKCDNPLYSTASEQKGSSGFEYSTELHAYKQKIQIFNKILNNIDSSMTYDQLAIKLESEFGFTSEESLFYAENFMKRLLLEI